MSKSTRSNKKTNNLQSLAHSVRSQRVSLKLTQAELADFAGCGVIFIHQLETGKQTVRLDKVLDVLKVLGLQFKIEFGKELMTSVVSAS